MIRFEKISKTYPSPGKPDVQVLREVSLSIENGELVSIMGRSGAGKSTLMNIMGLLDRPTSGEYLIDGQPTSTLSKDELASLRNRKIGFIFQAFHLLPRLTALENVMLPLSYRKMDISVRQKRARKWLERVGLAEKAGQLPHQLSGGERQRVAIARALVGNPSMVLADEPTGALDEHNGRKIMQLFTQLNSRHDVTVIIITHDPLVARLCRRQLVLENGQLIPSPA